MDAHGARSPGGQVGQAEGRGVHDADDRLGLIVRAEFEQGGGHCPFAHMAYVVDHTVDFADVPVTLAGAAFGGSGGPEAVEVGDVGDSGAHKAQNLAVDFELIAGTTIRVLGARLGKVTRIELVVEGMLTGFFEKAGDFERKVAQVLWGLFACFFHSYQVYRSALMASDFSRSMACSAELSSVSQRALVKASGSEMSRENR